MNKLHLETVSRSDLRLVNKIFSRNGSLSFQLGRDRFDLFFTPRAPDFVPGIEVGIRVGERSFRLGLEKNMMMDLLEDFLEGERITDLPEPIQAAVFETVFEEPLDRFDAWAGSKTFVSDVNFEPSVKDLGQNIFFNLVRPGDQRSVQGQCSMDRDGLEWFSDLIGKIPASGMAQWDQVTVRAGFEVGRTRLALKALKTVAKQDIIFLDECPFKDDMRVLVRLSPHLCLQGVVKESVVVVEKIMEDIMVDEERLGEAGQEDSGPAIQASSIDELPVDLVFELGEKRITVGDLKTLQPGYTFELDTVMDKPVSIRANDKIIGFGELMQVDDRIGVRILELFQR